MSVDSKEIDRVKYFQISKKCINCKTGFYKNYGIIFCNNCGKEPFK